MHLPSQFPIRPQLHNAWPAWIFPQAMQTHGPMAARAAAPVQRGSSLSRKSTSPHGDHLREPRCVAVREQRGDSSTSPATCATLVCTLWLTLEGPATSDLPHPATLAHASLTALPAPRCPGGYHPTGGPGCRGLCRAFLWLLWEGSAWSPTYRSKITRKPLQTLTSDLTCRQKSCGPDLQPGL